MNQDMLRIIDSIARDRNVDKESLFYDIEQAMISAARKHFNAIDTEEFTCELDRMTGKITLWRGEEELDLATLGRIPAQTAKQVMIQRFREDERQSIYSEFADTVDELVVDARALVLAEALDHHLLGGLGGDAAELFERDLLLTSKDTDRAVHAVHLGVEVLGVHGVEVLASG